MDLMEQILFKWTGCDEINPGSRGYWYDGRSSPSWEKFFGQDFAGLYGPILLRNASTYSKSPPWSVREYYSQLMAQTHLKDLYSEISSHGMKEVKP